MTYINKNKQTKEAVLLQMRRDILAAEPEKALDMILSSDLPASLIQSFSEQDLYFLTHGIGINDAISILALSTSEQWGYMLDVEVWRKDALDIDAVTRWLRALLVADGRRLVRWLLMERQEFFELYLFKNIDVIVREENEDPSDFGDDYFTVDDYFYVRIKEKPVVIPDRGDDEMISQEDLDVVVRDLLEKLLEIDHGLYQSIMLEATGVIAAEIEEEVFRMRNVRLAEQGFLPFDEALEVFSPLTEDQIGEMTVTRKTKKFEDEEVVAFPLAHVAEIRGSNKFTDALALIDGMFDLGEFEMEFAALCNQIIAAEQNVIREKETLSKVVRKAGAYVSIGLEILEGPGTAGQNESGSLLQKLIMKHSLKNLFRLGVGRVMELKHQAERLNRDSWFTRSKLPLSFWGETYLGVFGGLLVKRPVFYTQAGSGALYRDFERLSDVEQTSKALADIKGFDDLLSMVAPRLEDFSGFFLTYANVLLTVWAHRRAGHAENNEGPVSLTDFRTFFSELWEAGDRGVDQRGVIHESAKKDFLQFLSRRSGFTEEEISKNLGASLENLFRDIEKEYGSVSDKNLDPRYLAHFCVIK